MKNQYFGDITDYRKFGILRVLEKAGIKIGVCWMLTLCGDSKDGKFTRYKNGADSELHEFLQGCIHANKRNIKELENSDMLRHVRYFSAPLLVGGGRRGYFDRAREEFKGMDLVFFDPDNGIEPDSLNPKSLKPKKHIEKSEIKKTWDAGFSILIFQDERSKTLHRLDVEIPEELKDLVQCASVHYFRFSKQKPISFYLLAQKKHKKKIEAAKQKIEQDWKEHGVVSRLIPNPLH